MIQQAYASAGLWTESSRMEVLSMAYNGFSIQKYVGVTPTEFAKLHKVLVTHMCQKRTWVDGVGIIWEVYAEIKSVSWNNEHGSLTIEVIVYDYARQLSGTTEENRKHYGYSRFSRTERWVVTKILNALGRFKAQTE